MIRIGQILRIIVNKPANHDTVINATKRPQLIQKQNYYQCLKKLQNIKFQHHRVSLFYALSQQFAQGRSSPSLTTQHFLDIRLGYQSQQQHYCLIIFIIKTSQHQHTMKAHNYISVGSYRYRQSDLLGSGYESSVYKAMHATKKFEVALKIIELDKISDGIHMKLLESELSCLQALRGTPNVINLIEVVRTQNTIFVITELCKGDLSSLVKKNMTEKQAWTYIRQLLKGYKCLYEKGIVHRDIKPQNMFIKSEGMIKIGDFGFAATSAQAKQQSYYNIGSPSYMAPQVLIRNDYSPASDVWSIGVSFFELAVGRLPWSGTDQQQIKSELTHENIYDTIMQSGLSTEAKELLTKMWNYDAYYRIKPEQLFEYKLYESQVEKLKSSFDFKNFDKMSISTAETPHRSTKNTTAKKYGNFLQADDFMDNILSKSTEIKLPVERHARRMSFDVALSKHENQQFLTQTKQEKQVHSENLIDDLRSPVAFKKKYRASLDSSHQNQLSKNIDTFVEQTIDKAINGYLQLGSICVKFLQNADQTNSNQKWASQLTVLKSCLKNHIISTIQRLENVSQSNILEKATSQDELKKYLDSSAYKKTLLQIQKSRQKYEQNKQIKKHWIRVRQQKHRAVTNAGLALIKAMKPFLQLKYDSKRYELVESICSLVEIFTHLNRNNSITVDTIMTITRVKRNNINFSALSKRIEEVERLK